MHVLAFANQKGGCGKTTTAVHLGGALAASGERTLLVDLDPQAHATLALGIATEPGRSVGRVLEGELTAAAALAEVPGPLTPFSEGSRAHAGATEGRYDVLPADESLAEFEETAARALHPEQALRAALAPLADAYDWVVLDCPPRADGLLCANALRACDTAVVVVESGAFALQGALKAQRIFEDLAEELSAPYSVRYLATLFDRRLRIARDLLIATQARFGSSLFETVVHTDVRLREAAAWGRPIQDLHPRGRAARDFASLAEEVRRHAHAELRPTPPPSTPARRPETADRPTAESAPRAPRPSSSTP